MHVRDGTYMCSIIKNVGTEEGVEKHKAPKILSIIYEQRDVKQIHAKSCGDPNSLSALTLALSPTKQHKNEGNSTHKQMVN